MSATLSRRWGSSLRSAGAPSRAASTQPPPPEPPRRQRQSLAVPDGPARDPRPRRRVPLGARAHARLGQPVLRAHGRPLPAARPAGDPRHRRVPRRHRQLPGRHRSREGHEAPLRDPRQRARSSSPSARWTRGSTSRESARRPWRCRRTAARRRSRCRTRGSTTRTSISSTPTCTTATRGSSTGSAGSSAASDEYEREALLAAENKLDESAQANGELARRAEENTAAMLESLVRSLGFETVNVRFEDPA